MFKLIKLAVYCVLGYALYEMYQGMMMERNRGGGGGGSGGSRGGQKSGGGRSRGASASAFGAGGENLTGPGEGQTVQTGDAAGTSASHRVGRGVVSR